MNRSRSVPPIALLVLAGGLAMAAGCTTGARQGAAQGGAMGFIGGMAAGAVNSLLFGGNVLEGAVQAGISGAAGGAAAGAVAGGMSERGATASKPSALSDREIEALRRKQGDLNFQAAVLLVQCRHQDAIAMADRAVAAAAKSEQKVFGLTVRAIAENESGKSADAEKTYAEIAQVDSKRTIDRARADALQGMLKVQSIRREQGLPPCGR